LCFFILAGTIAETKSPLRPSDLQEKAMKPIQVAILVAVAAVGGGLFTKWWIGRNIAPVAAATAQAPVAPITPAARVSEAKPAAVADQAQAQPRALPSPFAGAPLTGEKRRRASEIPRKPRNTRPVEPVLVAQNQEPTPAIDQALQPVPAPQPEAAAAQQPTPAVQVEPEAPAPQPPAPPPPPRQVTLRAGTLIPARTVEGLSSERNLAGDTFTATLDEPLVVDGLVIAERGAHLEGKIVQSQRAGRVKGVSDLAIELTQLNTSDGQRIAIETETFEKHGASSTGQDAAKVAAGAAIGAAIGAMAGGGKGAGIGAAVGTAAGVGGVMATRGKDAALPAETRISFRLRNSVTLSERQNGSS
jgi:hypothetical protein